MIAGLKAASLIDKAFTVLFVAIMVSYALALKGFAFVFLAMTLAHLRVLELEHKLRQLGVEP